MIEISKPIAIKCGRYELRLE